MPDENDELPADNVTLSDIINNTVADVSEPSPVADMPESPSDNGRLSAGGATPATNTDAQGVKRGRGRPRKTVSGESPPVTRPRPNLQGVPQSTLSNPVDVHNAGIEPCAEMAVMMVNASGMMLGGETAAMKENEIILAKNGFVGYFKIKGINNIPPSVMLLGALAPYYLRIMTTTPAKTTISTFSSRAWFRVKEIWKARKNARSNNRDNIKRENDTGAETGSAGA